MAGLTRRTPIVCAGASQGPLVASGVQQLGIDRARIFGSAPWALVSGLRALVALEAHVSPGEVAINLLGVPPAHTVVPWSSATIGGYPLEDTLSPPQLARLRDRVEHLWPPGPFVLASAAARVVEALVVGGARRRFACFVGDGSGKGQGLRSVGVTLGPGGIEEILPVTLSRPRAGSTGERAWRRRLTTTIVRAVCSAALPQAAERIASPSAKSASCSRRINRPRWRRNFKV